MLSPRLPTRTLDLVPGPRMLLQSGNLEATSNMKEGERRFAEKKIILMAIRRDSCGRQCLVCSVSVTFVGLESFRVQEHEANRGM